MSKDRSTTPASVATRLRELLETAHQSWGQNPGWSDVVSAMQDAATILETSPASETEAGSEIPAGHDLEQRIKNMARQFFEDSGEGSTMAEYESDLRSLVEATRAIASTSSSATQATISEARDVLLMWRQGLQQKNYPTADEWMTARVVRTDKVLGLISSLLTSSDSVER